MVVSSRRLIPSSPAQQLFPPVMLHSFPQKTRSPRKITILSGQGCVFRYHPFPPRIRFPPDITVRCRSGSTPHPPSVASVLVMKVSLAGNYQPFRPSWYCLPAVRYVTEALPIKTPADQNNFFSPSPFTTSTTAVTAIHPFSTPVHITIYLSLIPSTLSPKRE